MKLELKTDEWGYMIDPETLEMKNIIEEVPEGFFILIKAKEHVEDIGRTIVNTEYGYVEKNAFRPLDKRGLSAKISESCANYILQTNNMPRHITLKKDMKDNKPVELLFTLSVYDQFHLKLTPEQLKTDNPKELIEEIIKNTDFGKEEEEEEHKWKVEYAKSSRSTCKKCGEKIEKGVVRIGKPNLFQEHLNYQWHHVECIYWPSVFRSSFDDMSEINVEDREILKEKFKK